MDKKMIDQVYLKPIKKEWEELEGLPLNEGKIEWKKHIETIDQVDYANRITAGEAKQPARYFMLEFVQEDDDGQFFEDAKTLISLLEEKNN
ncbi:hypothetical protein JHE06_01670 [Carnobacterium sp. CS13]|uniref:hypothetical protein n=1 Tax=unclassified Carnobacterium TaxID=257487 RepID=UPI001913A1C3|nr:hypothetical protein [Carnobacterium sp. CS13]QQP70556.1 hypothetical protein JHE06_01670 [Carnobacterium sp. CS13]